MKNGLSVVDVGARNNFEDHWKIYKDQIKLIGFEPDASECRRLNKKYGSKNKIFFPVALGNKKEMRTFYVMRYPASSGFLEPDLKWMGRFPDEQNLTVKKSIKMHTVDYDSYSKEAKLPVADFMKLDVEGFELQVLMGSKMSLVDVLGVSTEVEFQKNHKNQPIFCDVDNFLRSQGFLLFDATLYRHAKKSLPPISTAKEPGPTLNGQVLWAQVLYFRDPIGAINAGESSKRWTKTKLLRLMSLMELFNLNDCAMELAEHFYKRRLFTPKELRLFLNLLTPKIDRRKLTYQQYLSLVSRIRKRGYINQIHRVKLLILTLLSNSYVSNTIQYLKRLWLQR